MDWSLDFTIFMQWEFLSLYNLFPNPNGENVQKCIPKMVSKFKDDPTVKESGFVVLLGQVWVCVEKR